VYSPKVREDLVPRLYRLKVKLKRPMTHLVAEAVEAYLQQHEDQVPMAPASSSPPRNLSPETPSPESLKPVATSSS
jgi:hypothetical protein